MHFKIRPSMLFWSFTDMSADMSIYSLLILHWYVSRHVCLHSYDPSLVHSWICPFMHFWSFPEVHLHILASWVHSFIDALPDIGTFDPSLRHLQIDPLTLFWSFADVSADMSICALLLENLAPSLIHFQIHPSTHLILHWYISRYIHLRTWPFTDMFSGMSGYDLLALY